MSNRNTGVVTVVLLASIIAGTFLRFLALDREPLWLDEIHSIQAVLHASSISEAFWNYVIPAPTPPLYYFFIMGWAKVAGITEMALRLPSALIGTLSLPIFYFGLKGVFGRSLAASATIFLSLSWPAVYYSQEVRGYILVSLFCIISSICFAHINKQLGQGQDRASNWYWMLFWSVLASMTHPFGLLLTGFQFVYLFLTNITRRTVMLRALVLGLILGAIYGTWTYFNIRFGIGWLIGSSNMFDAPDWWFFVDVGAFLFHHPLAGAITAGGVLLLGGKSYYFRFLECLRNRNWTEPEIYAPIMLAAPFTIAFIVSQFQPLMYTRYLIVFLPYIYIFYGTILCRGELLVSLRPPVLAAILVIFGSYWVYRDFLILEKPQTNIISQIALAHLDDESVLLAGCSYDRAFSCKAGPNEKTNSRWSKYLYYLNPGQVIKFTTVPRPFRTIEELRSEIKSAEAFGKKRLIIIGSRKQTRYVSLAVEEFIRRKRKCDVQKFISANIAICNLT